MTTKGIGRVCVVALLTAACARSPAPFATVDPTGRDQLVMRVQNTGGLINPAFAADRVSEFSLFGDGSAFTPGAIPQLYPGPAIDEPVVTHISRTGVEAILEAAKQAGLFANNTSNGPGIPDTGTTVITVVDGGRTYVSRYVGLSPSGHDAEVARFVGKLSNLDSWLPTGAVGTDHPYVPASVAVTVTPYQHGNGPSEKPIAWPLTEPLSRFGAPTDLRGASCGAVAGDDLAKLLPLISRANQLTPWIDSGRSYSLAFRPLLPDQNSC